MKRNEHKIINNIMTKKQEILDLFHSRLTCTQAVFSVYGKDMGVDENMATAIATGFGAGIARSQQICGALTGAIMVLGLKYFNPENLNDSKELIYHKTSELMERFKNINSSCNCRELIGVDFNTKDGMEIAEKNDLFNTRCKKYLSDVCDILDELII
jgi:C_GCAxxG_C_C family probable redox protein